MSLDPRRVLVFRAAVRAGSLTAAARELGWTQSAVSQHLQALERAAGCPLLLRGPSGVTPTEAGRALLVRADAIAAALHMAEEELAGLTQLRRGRVRLAAHPSAAATLVPRAVAALERSHPGLDVELTEAEPPEAMALVSDGEVDLAVAFEYADATGSPPASVRWTPLADEPVDLVLPPGHRLAGRTRIGLAELAEDAWVMGCERCRDHVVRRCAEAGFEPRVRHVSDDYVVVQHLLAQGLGVALLPRSALEAYRHPDVVVHEARSLGTRTWGTVHREGAELVPATAAVLAQIRLLAGPRRRVSARR